MEQIDKTSLISVVLATIIIAIDLLNIEIPQYIHKFLSNKNTQIALGIGIILASYYHLPSSIVLASLLYFSLQDKHNTPQDNTEQDNIEQNINTQKVPIHALKDAPKNLIPNKGNTDNTNSNTNINDSNTNEFIPMKNVNDVGVMGMFSDPTLEPSKNPLPTQTNTDFLNTKIKETKENKKDVIKNNKDVEDIEPTLLNKENLDSLVGFNGNDMANII